MSIPTLKQLLEAGVHFGHQTRRWDPKMKPYIFTERNGIHIIDLQQTMKSIKVVFNFIKAFGENQKDVLFVGTKKQAQAGIAAEARRCGMHFINQRWMGGTLTNFQTIKKSIQRVMEYEEQKENGLLRLLPKKEQQSIEKQIVKLNKSLGGIKSMKALPGAVFVVDPRREQIAVQEAKKLKIPIVALCDTNCNPETIDYVIPGNDDAIRAINLVTAAIAEAVIMGREEAKAQVSAPEVVFEDDKAFAPTEEEMGLVSEKMLIDEELEVFEKYEETFEEDFEDEVVRKRQLSRREEAREEEIEEIEEKMD